MSGEPRGRYVSCLELLSATHPNRSATVLALFLCLCSAFFLFGQ
jgi:hypothetical protein